MSEMQRFMNYCKSEDLEVTLDYAKGSNGWSCTLYCFDGFRTMQICEKKERKRDAREECAKKAFDVVDKVLTLKRTKNNQPRRRDSTDWDVSDLQTSLKEAIKKGKSYLKSLIEITRDSEDYLITINKQERKMELIYLKGNLEMVTVWSRTSKRDDYENMAEQLLWKIIWDA